jgi:uncharacterized Fe-S cluster protein YjdI
MESERRYAPDVARTYEGEGIRVLWEPKLCIHVANCIRHLPGVFDPQARPWIAATEATAGEIAEAIESCPTGALRYERTDGAPQEIPAVPTTVQPRRNGPLFVRGELQVTDMQRNVTRSATRMALCRCGQSGNKPFCDATHRKIGFQADA